MLTLLILGLLHAGLAQIAEVNFLVNIDSPIYSVGEITKTYVSTEEIFVERFNESTAYMSGNIVFKQDLPGGLIFEIVVKKEASGKFESLFTHDICDFCTEIGKPDGEYAKYLKYFGIPTECPISEGSYPIHDFTFDTSEMDVKSQHAGRYEAVLNIYVKTGENCKTDRDLIIQLKIDIVIEPE